MPWHRTRRWRAHAGQGRKDSEELNPDLVIGSVHSFPRAGLLYVRRRPQFESEEKCREILGQYVRELFNIAKLADFDVMGHIGYPLRYIKREGFDMDLSDFKSQLEELFRVLIEGQGRIKYCRPAQ